MFEQTKEKNIIQLKADSRNVGLKILRIFLASSNELLEEREKIEQALNRKNKELRKEGVLIELSIWEDAKYIGKSLRSQNNYNSEIESCDVFAMMFYSKVGKYSLEEVELAKSLFDTKQIPRILIFQKDIDLPKNISEVDFEGRSNFLKKLKELEHFPVTFNSTDKQIGRAHV